MAIEIEVKCKLNASQVPSLRKRLDSLGARFEGKDHERNLVLDTKDSVLKRENKLLRVRIIDRRATVTFKGPAKRTRHTKQREEIEFYTSEPKQALEVFNALGFAVVWEYQKRRENYSLGSTHIVIDQLPSLGWFAEVEASSEAKVREAVRRLKLPVEKLTTESYTKLARDHFAKRRNKLRDLLFR